MRLLTLLGLGLVALALLALACTTGGGREVTITAEANACSPASVDVKAGEKITFVVVNHAGGDRELEGIEGTKLEEILVPDGRTRRVNFTAPKESGVQKLKCYIPNGPSTIVDLRIKGGEEAAAADTSVNVALREWAVTPSVTEVSAGRIRFVVKNEGGGVHELAVVKPQASGEPQELPGAEVEDVKPGMTSEFVFDLKPGRYQLACLVAKGEFGSDRDHYAAGMHAEFVVR
jgi:uncharacterized cupredoxin-like copper-binding protein